MPRVNYNNSRHNNTGGCAGTLLAKYFGSLLEAAPQQQRATTTDDERRAKLQRAAAVLPYLADPDSFVKTYADLLVRRALQRRCHSLDLESISLALVRPIAVIEAHSRLQRILADAAISTKIEADFITAEHRLIDGGKHSICTTRGPPPAASGGGRAAAAARQERSSTHNLHACAEVALSPLVITNGAWSVPQEWIDSPSPPLPPPLAALQVRFGEFYAERHPSHRLRWLSGLGRAEVRATCPLPAQPSLFGR